MIYPDKELQKWLVSGVYCLINDSDKRVDVRYSNDCNKAIASILSEIKNSSLDYPEITKDYLAGKIEIRLLEKIDGKLNLMICDAKWNEYYKNIGYSTYRNKPSVKLRVVTKVESFGLKNWFVVKLVTSRYNETCVGVFKNKTELDGFIDKYYRNVERVYVADNAETNLYLAAEKDKPWENPLKSVYELA